MTVLVSESAMQKKIESNIFVPVPSVSLSLRVDDREMERMEELPLCSCRMEAPRVHKLATNTQPTCMAIESINGQVSE